MIKNDLIVREECLNNIRQFIDINMVKIIAGVRRCGKSYLLDMIADELISKGISSDHIIYRLYTSVEVEDGYIVNLKGEKKNKTPYDYDS